MKSNVFILLLVLFLPFTIAGVAADSGPEMVSFYQALFNQDEKHLYDYLESGLNEYVAHFPESPNTADAYYLLAKTYLAKGKEYEALAAGLKTLYLFPGFTGRQECISFATSIINTERSFRDQQEKYTELINRSVSGINLADRYYEYLNMLITLDESRLYDWTLASMHDFTVQYSDDSRLDTVLKWTGDLYLKKSDEWEASASFQMMDYLRPNSPLLPEVRFERAKLLYEKLNAYEAATAAFEQIADTWPNMENTPEALYLCGKVYKDKIKDYDKAITTFRRLVDNYPQHVKSVSALLEIGEIYEKKLGKYPEAIAAYNEFVEKYRTSPQGVDALTRVAEIYEKDLNDYKKAAEYYAQVAQYYPTFDKAPDMLIKAGELCEDKLNDPKQAIAYYQMLLNTFPEHKRARDAQKKMEKAKESMAAN